MADDKDDVLDPAEIEALLNSNLASGPAGPATPGTGPEPSAGGGLNSPPDAPSAAPGGERLSQRDLDALFQEAGKGAPEAQTATETMGADDIERLLKERSPGSRRRGADDPTSALLDQVEADLAAAIATDSPSPIGRGDQLQGIKDFEFAEFGSGVQNENTASLDALREVELDLRIELGRTQLLIEDVLKLREGSVVPLDKLAGDPVDILVNGRLVARGEVLVLNDNFCVRVAEIVSPSF